MNTFILNWNLERDVVINLWVSERRQKRVKGEKLLEQRKRENYTGTGNLRRNAQIAKCCYCSIIERDLSIMSHY